MKRLILAITTAIVLAGCASTKSVDKTHWAQCRSEFPALRDAAVKLTHGAVQARLTIGDIDFNEGRPFVNVEYKTNLYIPKNYGLVSNEGYNGHAVPATQTVQVLCAEDVISNRAVMAHELGHLVGDSRGEPDSEWQANVYGVLIEQMAGYKPQDYIPILEWECAKGNEYMCERKNAWRYAIGY